MTAIVEERNVSSTQLHWRRREGVVTTRRWGEEKSLTMGTPAIETMEETAPGPLPLPG